MMVLKKSMVLVVGVVFLMTTSCASIRTTESVKTEIAKKYTKTEQMPGPFGYNIKAAFSKDACNIDIVRYTRSVKKEYSVYEEKKYFCKECDWSDDEYAEILGRGLSGDYIKDRMEDGGCLLWNLYEGVLGTIIVSAIMIAGAPIAFLGTAGYCALGTFDTSETLNSWESVTHTEELETGHQPFANATIECRFNDGHASAQQGEAKNLLDWFAAQGEKVPSISRRAALYRAFGYTEKYRGTLQQNQRLLDKLQASQFTEGRSIRLETDKNGEAAFSLTQLGADFPAYANPWARVYLAGGNEPIGEISISAAQYAEVKKQVELVARPPYLKIEQAEVVDENRNQLFEADESAKLLLTISNTGKGPAWDVNAIISGFASRTFTIDKIEPDQRLTKEIPFAIPVRVESGAKALTVSLDAGKYSPPEKTVKFATRAAVPPVFNVKLDIDDDMAGQSMGNGNGVIEPRETIELTVRVSNTGKGFAKGVLVKAKTAAKGANLRADTIKIGNLPPGAEEVGSLVFFVPAGYTDKTLPVEIEVAEAFGLWQVAKTMDFQVGQESSAVVSNLPSYGFESAAQMTEGVFEGSIEITDLPAKGECNPSDPNAFAFIAGTYNYRHVDRLPYVGNDLALMKQVAQCWFGVPEKNIKIWRNPTRSDLLVSLSDEITRIKRRYSQPKIYFYYSGHGTVDSSGKVYLLPYDAQVNTLENLQATSLSLTDISARLAEAGGEKVALIDTCRVETSWKATRLSRIDDPSRDVLPTIFGSGLKQIGNVARGKSCSAFTYSLYDLFSKGNLGLLDINQNGWVDTDELVKGVNHKLGTISASPDQEAALEGASNIGVVKILR